MRIFDHKVVSCVLFASLAISFSLSARAADDFTELVAKLPASANTLVMLNAEQIFSSEVATAGGWKQKYDAAYSTSPLLLPPAAQQFVLAADLDLATMKTRSEVAVMRLADDPSISMINRTLRGTLDSVSGLEAIATQRGALIVKFGPKTFGLMQPGNRQTAARWVRGATTSAANQLSPYLKTASDVPDRVGTEIIMAIELTDALNRQRVQQSLANSDVLKKNTVDLNAAATTLMGIQGATLGVRVTRRTYGVLKIDFASDTKPIAAVAKPLLLEVLDEAGAAIDEFENWNVKVTPHQIAIDGELTSSGLRRLFSILDIDASPVAAADAGEASPTTQPGQPDPQTSLNYFQAINRSLEDLKAERGAKSYASIALWFDKYARKIDRLPILGVDKDLLDYGQFVVINLRNAVDAIRGVGIRSGAQTAQVTSGYSDYYVFDAAVNYASSPMNAASNEIGAVEAQRRAIRATERAQGTTDARGLMRIITDKQSEVRRQMTERYGIEFGAPAAKQ